MNRGLLKVAEGYEMMAAGIREMAAEENGLPKSEKKAAKAAQEKKEEAAEAKVSMEQVRAVLTEKSRAGKTQEVRSLLNEFGADKLSAVSEEVLPELLKKAEAL